MKLLAIACLFACMAGPAVACDVGDRANALMKEIRNGSMSVRKATGGVTGDMYFKAMAIERKHGGVHGRDRATEASLNRELMQLERELASIKAR